MFGSTFLKLIKSLATWVLLKLLIFLIGMMAPRPLLSEWSLRKPAAVMLVSGLKVVTCLRLFVNGVKSEKFALNMGVTSNELLGVVRILTPEVR